MITNIYRKYIPKKYRNLIYSLILGDILFFLRYHRIIIRAQFSYWFHFIIPRTSTNKAYAFMGKYGICLLPYDFTLKYKKLNIIQYRDESNQLTYVIHNNKKLYFPRNLKSAEIDKTYKQLLAEQDECSSHRYVNCWEELSGKNFLDIGAAEGMISLNVIDTVKHVYLFECDENWIEALNATFAPYKSKVTIINKYVSNTNNDSNLTIDHFLHGKMINNLFIKMDIEGAELSALQGATKLLADSENLQLAICTYHREDDFKKISDLLSEKNIHYENTAGNVFHESEFRIGVVRAKK